MRVALTGGTGFIGQRVVRILRERGHDVVCGVRTPGTATELAQMGAALSRNLTLSVDTTRARSERGWTPRPTDVALREALADVFQQRGRTLPQATALPPGAPG